MPGAAVVDTNVWVSAFLNPRGFPHRLLQAAQESQFTLVISAPMLEELQEVLCRPRIMKIRGTTQTEAEDFTRLVAGIAQIVIVGGTLRLCRDSDDDLILETAVVGHATHVVSRDEDITRDPDLEQQLKARGIQAITISRFLRELG
jgi:putative PIN family toxin of toxin-antitoxin system